MKFFLDFVPAAAFLAALLLTDIYGATVVLIVTLWLAVLAWRLKYGEVRRTHLWIVLAATVLGGLTLWLHNPTFIKWKPTVVYCAFGVFFIANAILHKPPLLEKALGQAFDLPRERWRRIDFAWAAFWFACAALNLVVAFNFSEKAWGTYKVVSAYVLPILFFLAHLPFIGRHLRHEEKAAP